MIDHDLTSSIVDLIIYIDVDKLDYVNVTKNQKKKRNKGAETTIIIRNLQNETGHLYINDAHVLILWIIRTIRNLYTNNETETETETETESEVEEKSTQIRFCLEKDIIEALEYYFSTFFNTYFNYFENPYSAAHAYIYRGRYKSRGMKTQRIILTNEDWFIRNRINCSPTDNHSVTDWKNAEHTINIDQQWVNGRVRKIKTPEHDNRTIVKTREGGQNVWYYEWAESSGGYIERTNAIEKLMDSLRKAYPNDLFNEIN